MNKSVLQRKQHVDKAHTLSITKQCELLSIPRSSYYYQPNKESALNLALMRLIDEKHIKYPWLGVPRITDWLQLDMGYKVNTKRVARLFGLLNIQAIGPNPNTSKKGKGTNHSVYPYLLKNLEIERPNQVWSCDITYVPLRGGYLYLFALIDIYSRYVLDWSLSNTMTSKWCREILDRAINTHGAPEILNTDQGSQFTALDFSQWVTHPDQGIKLSMDGKGRALDNIFVERLWRSVKYEHVYLFPANDGKQCYRGLKEYFDYYNTERRHDSLQKQTPQAVYRSKSSIKAAPSFQQFSATL